MHASERARAVRSGNSALDVHDRDGETRRIVKVSILALERLDYCPTILCCMVCGVACSPDSPSCQCSRKRIGGLASGSLRSSTKHELRLGMMMDIEWRHKVAYVFRRTLAAKRGFMSHPCTWITVRMEACAIARHVIMAVARSIHEAISVMRSRQRQSGVHSCSSSAEAV